MRNLVAKAIRWTVTEENTRCFPLASTCAHMVHAYTTHTKKNEKVMYMLIVSHLPHESVLLYFQICHTACLAFLFTYYRYLIFKKKVFGNNVRLTESCKDAESSHTALIFFLFPTRLGKSVDNVSCIRSVPRSHVFKNPDVSGFQL